MGGQNTRIGEHKIRHIQTSNNNYFGKFDLFEAIRHNRLIAGVVGNSHEDDVLERLEKIRHPNLVKTWTYDSDLREVFGQKAKGIKFYVDYLDTTLEEIIRSRCPRGQRFSEAEVLRILYDILQVLAYFEQIDKAHWDLSTSSVFYDPIDKKIKIYDNEIVRSRLSGYKNLRNRKFAYPTPEFCAVLGRRQSIDLEKIKNKTDIFTLGLIILEVCTYENSEQLFDSKSFTMLDQLIEQRILKVRLLYGIKLEVMIRELLKTNPKDRLSAKDLLNRFGQPLVIQSTVSIASPVRAVSPIKTTTTTAVNVVPTNVTNSQIKNWGMNRSSLVILPQAIQTNPLSQSQIIRSTSTSRVISTSTIIPPRSISQSFVQNVSYKVPPTTFKPISSPINVPVSMQDKLHHLDQRVNEVLKRSQAITNSNAQQQQQDAEN